MAQRYIKGGHFRKVTLEADGNGFHLNWQPLQEAIDRTQLKLDAMVLDDMVELMPYDEEHALINETIALNNQLAGSGKVLAYPPLSDYGHYQYEGIVYVDPVYGYASFPVYDENGAYVGLRSRKGVTKIPSNRLLHYNNPQAVRHWAEVAESRNRKKWENFVLEELVK